MFNLAGCFLFHKNTLVEITFAQPWAFSQVAL